MSEKKDGEPTKKQLDQCALLGWEYIGDGLFVREPLIGWFDEHKGFIKESGDTEDANV